MNLTSRVPTLILFVAITKAVDPTPTHSKENNQKMNHNQNFSNNASISYLLKNGQWSDSDMDAVVAGMK